MYVYIKKRNPAYVVDYDVMSLNILLTNANNYTKRLQNIHQILQFY